MLLKEERAPVSPPSGDVTLQLSDQLRVHRQEEEKPPPTGPVCGSQHCCEHVTPRVTVRHTCSHMTSDSRCKNTRDLQMQKKRPL